jgi:hypothetical protein
VELPAASPFRLQDLLVRQSEAPHLLRQSLMQQEAYPVAQLALLVHPLRMLLQDCPALKVLAQLGLARAKDSAQARASAPKVRPCRLVLCRLVRRSPTWQVRYLPPVFQARRLPMRQVWFHRRQPRFLVRRLPMRADSFRRRRPRFRVPRSAAAYRCLRLRVLSFRAVRFLVVW